jgi:hypothetical protein
MKLPQNADRILSVRMKGLIYNDTLIVSFYDKPRISYDPVVYARPEESYDWRFAERMATCVVCPIGMSSFERHAVDLLKHVARPLMYYHPDAEQGGSLYYFPTADSIDAWVQGKITKTQWKWSLDNEYWMDFQNNQFQKFLSEVACETDPRYH